MVELTCILLLLAGGPGPRADRNAGVEARTVPKATGSEEMPSDFTSLGVHFQGAGSSPGGEALWGVGVSAGLTRGAFTGRVTSSLWAPLVDVGSDYYLRVQFLTARLGAGVNLATGAWLLGADAGPGLRLIWEERSGEQIDAGRRWYISAGLGADVYATWMLERGAGVRLSVSADYFYPHHRFTVDRRRILDTGRFLVGSMLSLVFLI